MIKIKLGWLLILCVTLFTGCSEEEFLEEPAPTEQVSEDVIFGSRAGVEAYLSGLNRRARSQFTNVDAAGINSIYFARTVKGNDIIQSNNWFGFDYDNDNREPTYRRTNFSWQFPYYMINQINTLINGVEASGSLSDVDKSELAAQGRTLRAFYYFQLALEFQQSYHLDPSAPAPPIYLELSLVGNPMTTMQEIYDLIVSDLESALIDLPSSRISKSYINDRVAHGILARVNMVMREWDDAEINAKAAYGGDMNAVLAPGRYQEGFDDIGNPEWIWGMQQTGDQSNYYWNAPSVMMEHFSLSYYATYVNAKFVERFSSTDVRNTFQNLYGAPAGSFREFISTKFKFAFDADIVLMRTPEMMLIEAEALLWQGGQDESAHDILYALQLNRDPQAVRSSNTGDALLEEILIERRKEMYAEFGVEWFDAKRLSRGITRDSNHRTVLTLEPNDKRFFLKIPQTEIDANDAIDESVNANR
ncbi:MAG: RagB/SusD family nutrient uptake outer membrane protein [Bacteroidota bacterium]